MPSIPLLGSDRTALSLAHASSRNEYSAAPAFAPTSPWNLFAQNALPTLVPRALGAVNTTVSMQEHQKHAVRVASISAASISLGSALLAVYWFCMMRRNFRRDLVLLLILGGSWKSLWFLIFIAATFVYGDIPSGSPFCQASGYLLLVGFESCDIAILLMSMHMCLQIFPHSRGIFGHDGLYPLRKWVIGTWFVLPHVIASLAFINPNGGFIAQGAVCWLPVRPFWYRLALYWVPRYLIWMYITYVAVRIYRHVGSEFKVFGQERDRSSSFGMPGESSIDRAKQRGEMRSRVCVANAPSDEREDRCAPDDLSVRLDLSDEPSMRSLQDGNKGKDSAPEWSNIAFTTDLAPGTPVARSMPTSRRGSKMLVPGVLSEDFAPPATFDVSRHRGSITSLGSQRSAGHTSFAEDLGSPPIIEGLPSQSAATHSTPSSNIANRTMELRRRAIQRQLRLLFIYPCVYMILWIIPFVSHCMNYTTYYAHQPIWQLNLVSTFCMSIMTFGDVIIFSWREKPWRHIAGSDGTFVGSLCWWRYAFGGTWAQARRESRAPSFPTQVDEKEQERPRGQSVSHIGLLASIKRWSLSITGHSPRGSESSGTMPAAPTPLATTVRQTVRHIRTYSGGSDRKHLEAERAHERLAMERADYEQNRRSLQERRASVVSSQQRRDWFDRSVDDDLFDDKHGPEGDRRGPL